MHRRGDLAAVVQQARHLQLVAVALGHVKVCQRPFGRGIGGFGQHHRQGGHTLAMPTGVGRLFVDGDVNELDERLEQAFKLSDEQPIGQRNGRLRCQRFGQALVGLRESHHLPRFRVQRIEQLQHANERAVVVLHRHGQKRLRTAACTLIKGARA